MLDKLLNKSHQNNKKIEPVKERYNSLQYQCFKRLYPGDVIYAKMPLSNDELMVMEEKHRYRPFLVVYKGKTAVYGYQCSSSLMPWMKSYEFHLYRQSVYYNNKDSYFQLNRFYRIPIGYINRYLTTLYFDDCYEIQRKLLMSENHHHPKIHFDIRVSLRLGDIFIKDHHLYLIYQNDNSYHYAVRANEYSQARKDAVEADGVWYQFDFNNKLILEKDEYHSLYHHLNYNQLTQQEKLRKKHKMDKKYKPHGFSLKRGVILADATGKEYLYLYSYNHESYVLKLENYPDRKKITKLTDFREIKLSRQISLQEYYDICVSCMPARDAMVNAELDRILSEIEEKNAKADPEKSVSFITYLKSLFKKQS